MNIILLSGGTDGGNSECILYNQKMLCERQIKLPIIFAGNKNCWDEAKSLAQKYNLNEYFCENVMPKLNV